MSTSETLTLILRVTMETAVVAAFGYWGFEQADGTAASIALAIIVPAVMFGIWGLIDFHQFRHGEPLRLIEELAITGLAAIALYSVGGHLLAWALVVLSVGYHALVYTQGARLLSPQGEPHR